MPSACHESIAETVATETSRRSPPESLYGLAHELEGAVYLDYRPDRDERKFRAELAIRFATSLLGHHRPGAEQANEPVSRSQLQAELTRRGLEDSERHRRTQSRAGGE